MKGFSLYMSRIFLVLLLAVTALNPAHAAALSDYLENKVIDDFLRATAYSPPATVYVALLTAAPNDTGGGTEVSGGNYARVAVTSATTAWNNTQASGTGASRTSVAPVTGCAISSRRAWSMTRGIETSPTRRGPP